MVVIYVQMYNYLPYLGAASKKKWYFWVVGAFGGVRGPTTTFGQKSTSLFFWFHSMQKPSKRVNTHKIFFIWVYHPIPLVNRGFQPVKGYCQRGVKISLSSLINFFPFQGILSLKKFFDKKNWYLHHNWGRGGVATLWWAPPKSTNFFF